MSLPLKVYSSGTANGLKVSIYLGLLGLKYDKTVIDISTNVQKEPWFTKINPNGRIPALIDPNTNITVSQTGAILRYLAETYDKDHRFSYKAGTKEHFSELEVLFFQCAENGPMQGQANHFAIYAPEKVEYGIERYKNETRRIYGVFDEYLRRNQEHGFLVGPHISAADVAFYPWARGLHILDIDLKDFPLVYKWFEKISAIEAVQKALL